jgi:hypothetical protein
MFFTVILQKKKKLRFLSIIFCEMSSAVTYAVSVKWFPYNIIKLLLT